MIDAITVILTIPDPGPEVIRLIQEQKLAFDEAKALSMAGHLVPPLLRITYLESTAELSRLIHSHLTSGGSYQAIGYTIGCPIVEEMP